MLSSPEGGAAAAAAATVFASMSTSRGEAVRNALFSYGHKEKQIFFAEFLGTFILVFFCDCVSLEYLAQDGALYIQVAFGIGISVMMAVHSAIGPSGAHLNPAVTTGYMLFGMFPWKHIHIYFIAEYLGAFAGAAMGYGIYIDCLKNQIEPTGNYTILGASAFTSVPGSHDPSITTMALDQVLCSMCLMLIVLAMTDPRNCGIPLHLQPLTVGLGIVGIRLALGQNTGCSMNPAADMAGRLLTSFVGFEDVWKVGDHMWWVPWLMPHVGTTLACAVYYLAISAHYPKLEDKKS